MSKFYKILESILDTEMTKAKELYDKDIDIVNSDHILKHIDHNSKGALNYSKLREAIELITN